MRYNILRIWVVGLLLCGCSGFLEEQSQSEIRPSTVKDMEKLLEGEGYPKGPEGAVFNAGTDIFTDNLECTTLPMEEIKAMNLKRLRARYAWESDMFDAVEYGSSDNSFWTSCYDKIKGCNVILDYVGDMKGNEIRREHLRGEAYALRGFYYLMLTNFFGMPYNYGDPEKYLAVPLKLHSGVTTDYAELKKESVATCYRQIEKDLLEGARVMYENREEQSTKASRLNYLSTYALLSRVYLYMGNFDNALKYADLVLKEKQDLLGVAKDVRVNVYHVGKSPEILWCMPWYFNTSNAAGSPDYIVSTDLLQCYAWDRKGDVEDIRGMYDPKTLASSPGGSWITKGMKYYRPPGGTTQRLTFPAYILKGSSTGDGNTFYGGGIRVAEMYLNRAEVYCRRYLASGNAGDATLALTDLNFLRSHRFVSGYVDFEVSDFDSPQALLDFCLRERRRELSMEGNHRWFDLRRTGMPELQHLYVDPSGVQTEYVLQENSPAYQLPIPEVIKNNNPSLK